MEQYDAWLESQWNNWEVLVFEQDFELAVWSPVLPYAFVETSDNSENKSLFFFISNSFLAKSPENSTQPARFDTLPAP
jgi:hypothetical protein